MARSSVPFLLVAALSVAAIVPHLNQSSTSTSGSGTSAGDAAASTTADRGAGSGAQRGVADLLAEQFQVDISDRALRKRVEDALDTLSTHNTSGEYQSDVVRASALVLGAYLCDEPTRRGDTQQESVRKLARVLAGQRRNFVPCAGIDRPVSVISQDAVLSLTRYVDAMLRADPFDKDLLTRTALHAAIHGTPLRFLIATVPDPVDSYETWQFDPMLDALRQAIEDMDYTFQRFQFPDVAVEGKPPSSVRDQQQQHRHWPGVVLFRKKDDSKTSAASGEVLVLFLVPETPTAGIHHEPFQRSIEFITSWIAEEPEWIPTVQPDSRSTLAGIVGPSFSGSTRSLAKAFADASNDLAKLPCKDVQVISGNASNSNNKAILERAIDIVCARDGQPSEGELPPAVSTGVTTFRLQFYATVHRNEAMREAVTSFKQGIGLAGRLATISENTAFGQNAGDTALSADQGTASGSDQNAAYRTNDDDLPITVPYNIAQLREGTTGARLMAPLDTVLPTVRPLPLADLVVPTDQPVVRTPQTMAAYVELVVRNLIDTIHRGRARAVQITMTDVRDRLFLAKELAQRAPDLMIFVTDGDLFYTHPEQYPWTKNLIVVSSYPLHEIPQQRDTPTTRVRQFANLGSQGVYNATLALLTSSTTELSPPSPAIPLSDYTLSDCSGMPADKRFPAPPVWINVVSRGELWPVQAQPVCDRESASYMWPGLSTTSTADVQQTAAPLPGELPQSPSPDTPVAATTTVPATTTTVGVLVGIVICISVLGFSAARYLLTGTLTRRVGIFLGAVLIAVSALNYANFRVAAAVFFLGVAPALFAWRVIRSEVTGRPRIARRSRIMLWSQVRSVRMEAAVTFVLWVVFSFYLWEVVRGDDIYRARLLEIESGVSPLLPMLLLAAIPLLLWSVVLRHRFLRGSTPHMHAVPPEVWAHRTIDILGPLMLGGLTDRLRTRFTNIYCSLSYLPRVLWIVVGIALYLFALVVFDFRQALSSRWNEWSPVWSVNGLRFGWLAFAGIMSLQLVLMVTLLQFLLQWLACADMLRALAQHHLAPAYKRVTKNLIPQSLVPKRLRLEQLKIVLDEMRNAGVKIYHGEELLIHGMQEDIRRRWFASPVWTEFIQRAIPPPPDVLSADADLRRLTWVATAAVVIVRSLLARLTLSLITLGACVTMLIGLQATISFQGSHRLLAVIWVDVIAIIVVVIRAFIQMDRDETLSLVTDTLPGQLNWNFDLLSKIAVYGVLPILLLFASQFPTLGTSIAGMFNSMPSMP